MGKFICFTFEKNLICLILFSHEGGLKKPDWEGKCGFREATVDILLEWNGFQYYSMFCSNNLVLI